MSTKDMMQSMNDIMRPNAELVWGRVRCCNCGRFRVGSFTTCKYCGFRDSTLSCSVKIAKPSENIEVSFIMDKAGEIDKSTIYAGPVRPLTDPVDMAVNVLSKRQHNELS